MASHKLQGASARWGRAAMASYFVVSATLNAAAHEASWHALASGAATAVDALYVLQVVAEAVSALLFTLGLFVGTIARAWIAYCVVRMFDGPALWQGGEVVVAQGPALMAYVAVAASLLLYLSFHERLYRERR